MSLFKKELSNVLRSMLFIVFFVAALAFQISQFGIGLSDNFSVDAPQPPTSAAADYGSVQDEDPSVVMPRAIEEILACMQNNAQFPTYPLGFYKGVTLNSEEVKVVEMMLQKITGLPYDQLMQHYDEWFMQNSTLVSAGEHDILHRNTDANVADGIPVVVDYSTFKAEMAKLDDMLGGGSNYTPDNLVSHFAYRPMTYEEALQEYDDMLHKDKVTGGYARLFSDYAGIGVALFAVFVPVGFLLRDRRADMQQLVYARRVSSLRLVTTRYIACLVAVLLPYLLLAIVPTVQLVVYCAQQGVASAPLAFYQYIFAWIAPTAMTACSVGFFFTTLTGTPLGIVVQFLWSFFSIIGGPLVGGPYGFSLIIRHNSHAARSVIDAHSSEIMINRLFYVGLSLVLLACSVAFYELERRGKLGALHSLAKIRRRGQNAAAANVAL